MTYLLLDHPSPAPRVVQCEREIERQHEYIGQCQTEQQIADALIRLAQLEREYRAHKAIQMPVRRGV